MEVGLSPLRSADGDGAFHRAAWDIGASGAPTAQSGNTPGFTLTRTGAGIYTLAYPKAYYGCPPIILPKTDTAVASKTTAFAPQSGTATIEFMDEAGAAVELTSGDDIYILIYLVTTQRA